MCSLAVARSHSSAKLRQGILKLFETETKNTIGEFDPEEKKKLDEEEQK